MSFRKDAHIQHHSNVVNIQQHKEQISTNTKLDTLIGHNDGVEQLLTDIKTNTHNIKASIEVGGDLYVSQDEVEAKLDTIIEHNDGVETLLTNLDTAQDLTNTKLDTINTTLTAGGVVDISTLSTHAKQDTINTTLGTLSTHAKQDTINTTLGTLSTHAKQDTINTTLGTLSTHAKQDTINTTLTDGTQEAKCMGIGDDGTNKQMKTDNSGNVSAFLVSDVVMKPSNITNGDHASFSGSSVASMLRCRTDINNNATGVFLLCDSAGALSVNSKSSVVKTTGEWLATSTAIGDDNYSSSLDCSSFKEVRIFGKLAGLSPSILDILGSTADSGTYYKIGTLVRNTIEIGGVAESHFTANLEMPPNSIKLYNNTGSGITVEFDYVGFSV